MQSTIPSSSLPSIESLYEQYSTPLVRALRAQYFVSQEEAEDILQDTFVKAFQARATIKEGNLKGWIYQIAHRTAIDALRQRSRRQRHEASLDLQPGREWYPDQENAETSATRAITLQQAFQALSPRQREVMSYVALGLSSQEIAATCSLTHVNVKTIVHRARLVLKKHTQGISS